MANKTKETLDKILVQARESVKILEALQKEGMARARSLMQIPTKEAAQKLTNDRVVSSLKKLGLATRSEVRELEKKVEELASELRGQISKVSRSGSKSHSKKSDHENDASA